MSETFNIHTEGLEDLEAMLKITNKKTLPTATRNTLNNLAFEMKGTRGRMGRIQARARSEFDYERNKTFIKAMSQADKATGNNISKMKSGAGIVERSGRTKVAKDLARQETGSDIKHTFAPLKESRVANSYSRKIKKRARHENLSYVDTTRVRRKNLMKVLVMAARVKKPVYIQGRKNKKKYIAIPTGEVETFQKGGERNKRKVRGVDRAGVRHTRVKLKFLYVRNPGGKAVLKQKAPFVQKAGKDALKKTRDIYAKEVDKVLFKKTK